MKKIVISALAIVGFIGAAYADNYSGGGGGGGGGSITLPQTIGGTVNSGGVACFTSTTVMASSATLPSGSLMEGGGSGACPTYVSPGLNVLTTLAAAVNATGGIISPTPTRAGDVVYWNGTNWVTLAGNNSGTVYLSENAAGVPSWASSSSSITFNTSCPSTSQTSSTINLTTGTTPAAKSGAYTATAADCQKVFTITGGPFSLPAVSGLPTTYGVTVINGNLTGGANETVQTTDSSTILAGGASATSVTQPPGESIYYSLNAADTGWVGTGTAPASGTLTSLYASGRYYPPNMYSLNAVGAVRVASDIYCGPYQISYPGVTIKGLTGYIATADASNYWSVAIYSNSGDAPGTLIDTITASINPTPVGNPSVTLANTTDNLPTGVVWICDSTSSTTAKFATFNSAWLGQVAMIGATSVSNAVTGTSATQGLYCVAGGSCGTGTAAWSGSTFTWPSTFSSPTWTDAASTGQITFFTLQVH